jgi:hypothetical protein
VGNRAETYALHAPYQQPIERNNMLTVILETLTLAAIFALFFVLSWLAPAFDAELMMALGR